MKQLKLTLIAAVLGTLGSTAVLAAELESDAQRQERMDRAYDDYRNQSPGPAARAENSIKRGAHRTGSAIEHGARRVGHAVGKGVRKTGEAIRHGGEKLEDKSTTKP